MSYLGTKLQWSDVITLVVFIWCFTGFWSAMPLLGWGEYAYEPLRTCCTLDYSKGDRYTSQYVVKEYQKNIITLKILGALYQC